MVQGYGFRPSSWLVFGRLGSRGQSSGDWDAPYVETWGWDTHVMSMATWLRTSCRGMLEVSAT